MAYSGIAKRSHRSLFREISMSTLNDAVESARQMISRHMQGATLNLDAAAAEVGAALFALQESADPAQVQPQSVVTAKFIKGGKTGGGG
jgi:hypothetical protein